MSEDKKDKQMSTVDKAADALLKRLSGVSVDDMQKLVRTDSKQEVVAQVVKGTGLLSANLEMRQTSSLGRTVDSLRPLILSTLDNLANAAQHPDSKAGIRSLANDLIAFMEDAGIAHTDYFGSLHFHNGRGTVVYATIRLERTRQSVLAEYGMVGPRWNWYFGRIDGGFTPAPDYRIESHTKSNFFGSKQKIVIVPLQTTLDSDKIAAILNAFPAAAFDLFESQGRLADHAANE